MAIFSTAIVFSWTFFRFICLVVGANDRQPSNSCSMGQTSISATADELGGSKDPKTYNLAREMLDGTGDFSKVFEADESLERLSVKLFNMNPSSLPKNLKDDIVSWLGSAPTAIEGMITPGVSPLAHLHRFV